MTRNRRLNWHCHGITIIEFLAASAASTVVGATVIVLMVGARDVFRAHTTLNELSGYLEVATNMLRKDIWWATGSSKDASDVCPSAWLRLTNGAQTITYCLDTAVAANVKLRRTDTGGQTWNVAQYVVQGANTSNNAAAVGPGPTLVEVKVQVRKSILGGRQFIRQVRAQYRRQP